MLQEASEIKQEVYSGNDNYIMSIEDVDSYLFVHIDVHNWSPSILKLIRCDFEELKLDAYGNGYDNIFSYTSNPKFAKLVDGSCKYADSIDDGVEVLYWELGDYYGN